VDFDSTIPRFESWRPSQPAESLPSGIRRQKKPGRETTPGQVNNNQLLPDE
jgi:hypothetical protein